MNRWLRHSIISGSIAGVAAIAAATVCGLKEGEAPAGPVNATSHIVWGISAVRQDVVSWRYTVTGTALNLIALIFWAMLFERLGPARPARSAIARGIRIAGVAYITDYHLIPRRFTPGFEYRLSNRSLAVVYGAIAVGLAGGHHIARRSSKDHEKQTTARTSRKK